MFGTLGASPPPAVLAAPVNSVVYKFDRALPEVPMFKKGFPVQLQQFAPNSGKPGVGWF